MCLCYTISSRHLLLAYRAFTFRILLSVSEDSEQFSSEDWQKGKKDMPCDTDQLHNLHPEHTKMEIKCRAVYGSSEKRVRPRWNRSTSQKPYGTTPNLHVLSASPAMSASAAWSALPSALGLPIVVSMWKASWIHSEREAPGTHDQQLPQAQIKIYALDKPT